MTRHIVLLVITGSDICPAGDDHTDVTVKRVVNDEIEYILFNRVCHSIIRCEDGVEPA